MILQLELIYNWIMAVLGSCSDNFGHVVYSVDNIFEFCEMLGEKSVTIFRPPKDGNMAFIRSSDLISFELLQQC